MNRIELIKESIGTDALTNMYVLLNKISPGLIVPEADKYYVFVYTPQTRGIRYDQHPFIQCTSVHSWGFIGYNFHWDEHRRYTWQEVQSNLFEIYDDEVEDMKNFPIPLFKQR